jgi:hypothetical protein
MPSTQTGSLQKSIERERQAFLHAKARLREKEQRLAAPRQEATSQQRGHRHALPSSKHDRPNESPQDGRHQPTKQPTPLSSRSKQSNGAPSGKAETNQSRFAQDAWHPAGALNYNGALEATPLAAAEGNKSLNKQVKELQRKLEQESRRTAAAVSHIGDLERDVRRIHDIYILHRQPSIALDRLK